MDQVFDFTRAPNRLLSDPGELLLENNLPGEAIPFLLKRLEEIPNDWRAYSNLGCAYCSSGRFDEASRSFMQALELAPYSWTVYHNLGSLLEELGEFDSALENRRIAWNIIRNDGLKHPIGHYQQVAFNLSLSLLRSGQWTEAWPLYRYGLYRGSWQEPPGMEVWKGENLNGKRLLILREGGYGDTFCYLRFFKAVKDQGALVSVYVWDKQIEILSQCPWVDRWLPASREIDIREHDCAIGIMQVPGVLGITPEMMPPPFPIAAEPLPIERNGKPLVGLCWTAEENGVPRKFRSIPDAQAESLASIPVAWYSLVPGRSLSFTQPLRQSDWVETARLIASLDLVVTVDTAVLHLAASMGKPTILVVPCNSDSKWMTGSNKTCWYPSVELVRNNDPHKWDGAIAQVKELTGKWGVD